MDFENSLPRRHDDKESRPNDNEHGAGTSGNAESDREIRPDQIRRQLPAG